MAQTPSVMAARILDTTTAEPGHGVEAQRPTARVAVSNLLGHTGSCRGRSKRSRVILPLLKHEKMFSGYRGCGYKHPVSLLETLKNPYFPSGGSALFVMRDAHPYSGVVVERHGPYFGSERNELCVVMNITHPSCAGPLKTTHPSYAGPLNAQCVMLNIMPPNCAGSLKITHPSCAETLKRRQFRALPRRWNNDSPKLCPGGMFSDCCIPNCCCSTFGSPNVPDIRAALSRGS